MSLLENIKVAKAAFKDLSFLDTKTKNNALKAIANALKDNQEAIILANQKDLKRSEEEALDLPLLKRLKFDEDKINGVIEGIESLIQLDDPVGETRMHTELDKGLDLFRIACPIGLIGVIFESRPDALVQISTLCLKSGNCALLKGGSEAKETNRVLADVIYKASVEAGIPRGWLNLLETREDVAGILKMDDYIDLIIPRGSNAFVKYIMAHSNIPVLGHADGICHVYVDDQGDIDLAVKVANDSKTQYVSVCNATETLLVHKHIAAEFLPKIKEKLEESHVTIYGCEITQGIIDCEKATEEDYKTEYLDYKITIKVVENQTEAINHINQYGSGHTDAIVSQHEGHTNRFINEVDSGNVFVNCSTRFSDGFRYGFGAEVGVSTNKIHARGPVGLEGLMIYKYKLIGNGHIVKDYADQNKKFIHKKIL